MAGGGEGEEGISRREEVERERWQGEARERREEREKGGNMVTISFFTHELTSGRDIFSYL